ncbi:MAG: hypothetical protein L0Z47_03945 [Actinobacteria bacterium]|nr:hypothetical protein [Actinomycetota bacterium]
MSIQRPIGGILAFLAMVWVFVWAVRARAGKGYDVAQLGVVLSLAFLVIGAVLGVLLGLQLAEVEIVAPENTNRLAESHPGACGRCDRVRGWSRPRERGVESESSPRSSASPCSMGSPPI